VPGDLLLISLARLALRGPGPPAAPRRWFASVSAATPLASGGPPRGGGGGPGNGDGGGGGGDGWKRPRASQGAGVVEEAAAQGADAIVLDVGV
jgi:Cu2+-exporting ATPase